MIDSKAASLAFALTVSVVYLVCAFAFYLFPIGALEFFGTWVHGIDLVKIATSKPRTVPLFITGLVSAFVLSYICAAIFCALYNAFCKK